MSNEEIGKIYDLLRTLTDKLSVLETRVAVLATEFEAISKAIETGRSRMWGIAEKLVILASGAAAGHFFGG